MVAPLRARKVEAGPKPVVHGRDLRPRTQNGVAVKKAKPNYFNRPNYTAYKRHHRTLPTKRIPRRGPRKVEESEWQAVATAAFLSLTFLAVVTILFEKGKEKVVELASRSLRPIITSLFSELTVLGFLGLVTFLITKTSLLPTLSVELFCDGKACWHVCRHEESPHDCVNEKKNKMQELFETIHMTLFLVMVLFICLGLINLKISTKAYKLWKHWDELCAENFQLVRSQYRQRNPRSSKSQMVFSSIRSVFIANPDKPKDALNADFPFAKYLYEVLGKEVAEITEVPIASWIFLECVLVCWYIVIEVVEGNNEVLTWVWIIYAWLLVLGAFVLEKKLEQICMQSCVEEDLLDYTPQYADDEDETVPLVKSASHLENGHGTNRLPKYISTVPSSSNRFVAFWVGNKSLPSRHEMMFWFRQLGPQFHTFAIRQLMLGMSIHLAVFTIIYANALWEETYHFRLFGIFGILLELILAYTPPVVFLLHIPVILRLHVESCSIGSFRHHHKDTLKRIIRMQRTEKALRIMKVLSNARLLKLREKKLKGAGAPSTLPKEYSEELSPALRRQVLDAEQAWKCVDADHSGTIEPDEMKLLMQSIGQTCGQEDIDYMMKQLDFDGDGVVSKDEFIRWIIEQNQGSDASIDELCESLFAMFDTDGSGSISVGEFIDKMRSVAKDLSIDDITLIARELDEDQSGTISMEEFRELIEKHADEFS